MQGQQKKIRLYSLSTCAVCKQVKKFLERHGIPYELTEVDLLEGGEQWLMTKEVKRYNPQVTYPTLVIEEVITGFDEETLKKSLGVS